MKALALFLLFWLAVLAGCEKANRPHPKPLGESWRAKYVREHDCRWSSHSEGYWHVDSSSQESLFAPGWSAWQCNDGKGHDVTIALEDVTCAALIPNDLLAAGHNAEAFDCRIGGTE